MEQVKKLQSVNQKKSEMNQNSKMGRLLHISSDPIQTADLMLEKNQIQKKSLKERFLSSLWHFFFVVLFSFGIIDYLYERLSLDMNMGYGIAFESFSSCILFIRGI
jgi:hypothetical protein